MIWGSKHSASSASIGSTSVPDSLSFSAAQCQQIMDLIQADIKNLSSWPNSAAPSHLAGNISTMPPIHFANPIQLNFTTVVSQ